MLSPGQTIDRYTVEAVIGHGGTAVVYLVRHKQLNSQHALKVLSLTSSAIRERLLREGRVQAALQHVNIVTVTDVLDIEGNPGLLMEHIDGPSLDQAMKRYKINLRDGLTLFRGVVAGVRAAHHHGLVHRDLKPANVLLFRSPEGFVPKVTDFGLAKLLVGSKQELGQTRQGIAMGTPAYMAPEQIRDARAVDQRADLFSLGCILYELATRQRAFPGDQALEIYNNIVAGRYTPPEEIVPDLPDAVIQAIDGCLILDREQRIPDCETLLQVLSGRQVWQVVEHPVPDDVMPTEEVSRDAPDMPVAMRKLTPVSAPDRATSPSSGASVEGSIGGATGASSTGSDRPFTRRSLATAVLLLLAPLFALIAVVAAVLWVALPSLWGAASEPARDPVEPQVVIDRPRAEPERSPRDLPEASAIATDDPVVDVAPELDTSRTVVRARGPIDDDPPQPTSVTPTPPIGESAVESEAAVQPQRAVVRLFSDPLTVAVAIDGRDQGRTPKKLTLSSGEHRVRVTSGDRVETFSIVVDPEADNMWCYSFPQAKHTSGKCSP